MKTIETLENELLEEFAFCEDWQEKYEYLIELGMDLPPLPPEHKVDSKRVYGCQSSVWLHGYLDPAQGVMRYEADSDAMIVKGLASILLSLFSGQPPEAVLQAQPTFFKRLGLEQHLSSTRSNGLASMIGEMKRYAAEYMAKP